MFAKKYLLYTALLLGVANAFGQTTAPAAPSSPVIPPKLMEGEGQPVRLVFADGRVATLMTTTPAIDTLKIPFQVTENLCRPQAAPPVCHYEFSYQSMAANFVWTTNPDAARIGQKLEYTFDPKSGATYQKLSDDNFTITSFLKTINHVIPVDVTSDRIVCDHYDWFPSDAATKRVRMKLWGGEFMIPNSETDLNENQTYFSFSNLVWQLDSKGLNFKFFHKADSSFAIPPLTDVSLMVFKDGANNCQVSVGANIQALTKVIQITPAPMTQVAPVNINFKYSIPNLYKEVTNRLLGYQEGTFR